VANRVSFTLSNFSKPYQMQTIRAAGFAVPDTLVTNDPDAVRRFRARHRKVIYKSASSVRSIVRLLDDAALRKLDAIRTLPTQFQAFIGGDNVRVHVVGTRTFAARIVSDAVDYRYAGRDGLDVDMIPFDLPDDVAGRCIDLARRLGLPFCGIDFKVSPGGEYVCFEVNPSPAYSYYQEVTGAPISDALVRYLAGLS
jgi:glutathione synthase/RimK-type ligase-like ATP-grasp enzyme